MTADGRCEIRRRLVNEQRDGGRRHVDGKLDPVSRRRRLDGYAERRGERITFVVQLGEEAPGSRGALDIDRSRVAEADLDPVVVRERRLDDLLLHLAVQ